MLKRTLSLAFSAAFLAATTVTVILPVERAGAQMATQDKSKAKSGMSGKERRAKCSSEWREMKAAGKTSALKWPKFYSECNKRLKGQAA
jgi:hypothetical protein